MRKSLFLVRATIFGSCDRLWAPKVQLEKSPNFAANIYTNVQRKAGWKRRETINSNNSKQFQINHTSNEYKRNNLERETTN